MRLISTDLTALLDDGVPAAGEAELVSNVARALDKVRVLQLAVTICALELGPTARPVIAPIAGAGHLVTPGPGGRRPVLKIKVLINYFNLTKIPSCPCLTCPGAEFVEDGRAEFGGRLGRAPGILGSGCIIPWPGL